jgi:hypothetical protein
MVGWIVLVVGLVVAGYAALFGVVSWEITLALIVVGLLDAAIGVWLIYRQRRQPTA